MEGVLANFLGANITANLRETFTVVSSWVKCNSHLDKRTESVAIIARNVEVFFKIN